MAIQRPASPFWRFLYENSLIIVVLLLTLGTLAGQFATGWHDYNDELRDMGLAQLSAGQYFQSGHFLEATFENWESEFLQMALYVLLTVWLRQRGSSESKKLYEEEEVDAEPDQSKKDAPWPVRQGGLVLLMYRNSLSIAFFGLFLLSFYLHARGGAEVYSIEQVHDGKPAVSIAEYMATSRFWFESLQNWQSEFLSILSIVGLSIFLRQHGSPESKPVDAAHGETGK
ncbi:hypothetical protein Q5H92_20675 [Hymenobacter sp. M29]|uniref:Transmembrane protein n=1 Tax=Hymenobacter mellowenesis TaxID=3063995 RepID=A0ABT9AHE5_9BACT|nr:DUF6766 family protein [Hymenobacter sp. M29]MDO7848792.1 hypothetical protein [Hymenobacter sp. M29]